MNCFNELLTSTKHFFKLDIKLPNHICEKLHLIDKKLIKWVIDESTYTWVNSSGTETRAKEKYFFAATDFDIIRELSRDTTEVVWIRSWIILKKINLFFNFVVTTRWNTCDSKSEQCHSRYLFGDSPNIKIQGFLKL